MNQVLRATTLSKEPNVEVVTRTLHLKVKPQGYGFLEKAAIEVNQVWNYCNETSYKAIRTYVGKATFLSGFDLNKLVAGSTKTIQRPGFSYLLSDSIQLVCQTFAQKRNQFKRVKLRFRKSFGSNQSLGWIPLKRACFQIKKGHKPKNGGIVYKGKSFPLYTFDYLRFNLEVLKAKLKQGSFSQDSVGDWYFNVVTETPLENV